MNSQLIVACALDDGCQFAIADEFVDENFGGHQATNMETFMPGNTEQPCQWHEEITEDVLNLQRLATNRESGSKHAVDHGDESYCHQHHYHDVNGNLPTSHGTFGDGIESIGCFDFFAQCHLTGKHSLIGFGPHDFGDENACRSRHN